MNYMYDALKVAGQEEEIIASIGIEEKFQPQPEDIPLSNELSAADIELIASHAWQPLTASLPTLVNHGPILEQFRGLRSKIYQAHKEKAVKTILVSSGLPSEGKSFVAANLAISLARNKDHRVLLIDGDLRRPSLHTLFGAPNEDGLSDYLTGAKDLKSILKRGSVTINSNGTGNIDLVNLLLISTGTHHENTYELLANRKINELIAAASPAFDWILIDSPPVLVFTDAVDLARASDAVLLVVRGAQTTFEIAKKAQSSFADSRILGVVLNDIKNPPRRNSYYDYYGYRAAEGESSNTREKK